MENQKKSRAFTLLEIIVTLIVIILIATTLPLMLQNSITSSKNAIKEEIFYQELSLVQLISSMYFDENNTIGDNYYKDLNATNGDDELYMLKTSNEIIGEYNRIGKIEIDNNYLRSGTFATVSEIGKDEGENSLSDFDDVDDFNNYSQKVTTAYGDVTLHVKVKYILDKTNYAANEILFNMNYSDTTDKTNIKLITVYSNVDGIDINLSYPSINIGASKFLSLDEIER